jgi:hypothetical protein
MDLSRALMSLGELALYLENDLVRAESLERAGRLRRVSEGLREGPATELDEAVDYALSSID